MAGDRRAGLTALATKAGLTAHGTILGTRPLHGARAARGPRGRRASDVFAFGAVLYEMRQGVGRSKARRSASFIAAILDRIRRSGIDASADTPPALDRIVAKCLAKDPDERWQSAKDLHDELTWVAGASSEGGAPGIAQSAATRRYQRSTSLLIAAWIVAGVFALALGSALVVPFFSQRVDAPEMRVDIVTPSTPDPVSFAISPDGRRLAFVASDGGAPRLWVRPLDALTPQVLAGTEGASYPFWSPDSRSVAFFVANRLMRIDIGGGLPQTLASVTVGRGGTWGSSGVIVFAPATSGIGLSRVSASGGQVTTDVTRIQLPQQSAHRFPQFLPDGRQFCSGSVARRTVEGFTSGRSTPPRSRGSPRPIPRGCICRAGCCSCSKQRSSRGASI